MNTYYDAFGQQVVAEWNANVEALSQDFPTFEEYLAYRRKIAAQPPQRPTPSPIGHRPPDYLNQLLQSPPGHTQKPAWLQKRHQPDNFAPQQEFGFGNQNQPTHDRPGFGALMGAPTGNLADDDFEEAESTPATSAHSLPVTKGMPRIFRQAEGIRPSEVEASVLDVVFRFFLSLVMVIVDLVTNVAFLTAPKLNPFQALSQSNATHWIFGLGLVFSEYLAVSYTRRLIKGGWKNLDVMEVLLVIALWALVALNFIATYLPLYNLRVGGEEAFAVIFALALSMVVAFFSERFLTHLAELFKALRS